MLVNGWRRHQTAVVNTFNYGMPAGSSGVDLNALPASALERIEVLRDGASAQYGSDAIAGVVNLVLKDGAFSPFVNGDVGRYTTDDYPDDGTTVNVNGGWGIGIGRGSLARVRRVPRPGGDQPGLGGRRSRTPAPAWPTRSTTSNGQVIEKRNPVPQPNHHWGDGLEKDVLTFANFRMPLNDEGITEIYSLRRLQPPRRHRQRASAATRTTRGTGREIYPLGFLPDVQRRRRPTTPAPAASGAWCRAGATTSAPSSGTTTSTTT